MKYFINVNIPKNTSSSVGSNKPPTSSFKRWDREFPQFEIWFIINMNPTGTYNIRNKDDSQRKRGVNCITRAPLAFEEGDPCIVGYYDCDRRKPYIIGMQGSGGTSPGTPIERIIFGDWRTWMANYYRWNAWVKPSDFEWWLAEAADDPNTGYSGAEFNGTARYESRPSDDYPWYQEFMGNVYTNGNLTWGDGFQTGYISAGYQNLAVQYSLFYPIGDPPEVDDIGTKQVSIDSILEDYPDIDPYEFAAAASFSRVGGSVYFEFRLSNTDEGITTIRVYCAKINVGSNEGDTGDILWLSKLYEISGEDASLDLTADLIHAKLPDDEFGNPVERLIYLTEGGGGCGSIDAITGDDINSDIISNGDGFPPSLIGYSAPKSFSDGEGSVWIQNNGTITYLGTVEEGVGEGWTFDLDANNIDFVNLFHVANDKCYCWGEWQEGTETVLDYVISDAEYNWGDGEFIDRVERVRGHSTFQGVVVIDALTGDFISKEDSGDGTEFSDQFDGPRVDSIYSDEFNYQIFRGQRQVYNSETDEYDIEDGGISNLLSEFNIPNYEQYFFRTGTYPESEHDTDHNPFLNSLILPPEEVAGYDRDDPVSLATFYEAYYDSLREDFINYQSSFIDLAAEARVVGDEEMKSQRMKVNIPQHPLTTGPPDYPFTYMDLNHTAIHPSSFPPVEYPYDLLTVPPKMGAFFSTDQRDINSQRPFRLYPRVPEDYSLTGQTDGGTPQKWVFFDEYKPYKGAPDLGPFEGLYSYEGGDIYSFSFIPFFGGCGDGAEGTTMTIEQSIIWKGHGDQTYERLRTQDPLYEISPCSFDGISHVHGPKSNRDIDTPAVWAKFTGANRDWTYELPGEVGGIYGIPIPLKVKLPGSGSGSGDIITGSGDIMGSGDIDDPNYHILYFTFCQLSSGDWKVIVISENGELVAIKDGIEDMLNPVFTDDAFRQIGKVWKPA